MEYGVLRQLLSLMLFSAFLGRAYDRHRRGCLSNNSPRHPPKKFKESINEFLELKEPPNFAKI